MFTEIAQPLIKLGIPVFPLSAGTKIPPAGFHFKEEATTDAVKIAEWGASNPHYNVAIYFNGTFCALEFDVKGGMATLCQELGKEIPVTRTQISAGKRCGHFIFLSTEYSRKIGNRSANLPDGAGEWFSFRQNGKYLVGAGSFLTEYGRSYDNQADIAPTPIPDWLVDAIAARTTLPTVHAKGMPALAADPEEVVQWYADQPESGFGIQRLDEWNGKPVIVTDICINAGYKHRGSEATGFIIGDTLGYKCFSQDCEGVGIGEVLHKLHDQGCKPFPGSIWEEAEMNFAALNVAELDQEQEAIKASEDVLPEEAEGQPPTAFLSFAQVEAILGLGAPNYTINPAVRPKKLVPMPPECLYGWLGQKARDLEMPLGFAYPAMVTAYAGQNIMQSGNVRPTMYTCLVGPVGCGKSVAADRATKSIVYSNGDAVKETVPGSDQGLYSLFEVKKPESQEAVALLKTHVLVQDELREMFGKMSIQGSSLAAALCKLWSKDEAGGALKGGVHTVQVRLSILGALKAKDTSDFAKVFGAATADGLYDRFVFAIIPRDWEYEDWSPAPVRRAPKGTTVPNFCYAMVKEWRRLGREVGLNRTRLGEIALRWALITASANHDNEVTVTGMEKALLFCEWQESVRSHYKAGVSDSLDGQCMAAVLDAFERLEGKPVRWSELAKRKNWYRDYHTSLGRIKMVLITDKILVEETKTELNERGEAKEKKTGRVFSPLQAEK